MEMKNIITLPSIRGDKIFITKKDMLKIWLALITHATNEECWNHSCCAYSVACRIYCKLPNAVIKNNIRQVQKYFGKTTHFHVTSIQSNR